MERPEDAEASTDGSHGQVADVVASELEGTVVADSGLGVWGKGGKAIDFFEDGEIGLSMVDGLKATEGLVMLVKASDNQFDGVVGGRDGVTADAVGEFGPVALQEIEDVTIQADGAARARRDDGKNGLPTRAMVRASKTLRSFLRAVEM